MGRVWVRIKEKPWKKMAKLTGAVLLICKKRMKKSRNKEIKDENNQWWAWWDLGKPKEL